MNGNTDVTLAHDSPGLQVFDVPLTAARNVTLPEGRAVGGMQLFSGRRFRFTKINASAFALNVKDKAGTTVASIASSQKGTIEVMWHRSGGAASFAWVVL